MSLEEANNRGRVEYGKLGFGFTRGCGCWPGFLECFQESIRVCDVCWGEVNAGCYFFKVFTSGRTNVNDPDSSWVFAAF